MNAGCLGKNAVAGGAGCQVFTHRTFLPDRYPCRKDRPERPLGRDVCVTVVSWLKPDAPD
jgi:hypothetical protein